MKKVISVCLILFIVFALFAGTALADQPQYTGKINSGLAVMLIDADTGAVLFKQNADEQIYPASTTKIMTCILAIENSSMDDTVTISAKAAGTGGSDLGIRENEKIKMRDLLIGMMLKSGNDAAVAAAEKISGSVEDFLALMNKKAESLGMASTHFESPNGLDSEGHFTTASDMARLARYAMQNQTFRDIVKLKEYKMPKTNRQNARTVKNTNWLLNPPDDHEDYYYKYATGIKTGSTPKAGGCLVSSAAKDGMNLICLVFGEKPSSKTQRWAISKKLFEWGFDHFRTIDVSALLGGPVNVMVQDCAADDAQGGLLEFRQPDAGSACATLPEDVARGLLDGTDTLEAKPAYDKELTAPVAEGDILGTVIYTSKATGEEVYSYDLIASRDISEQPAVISTTPEPTPEPTPEITPEMTPESTPAGGDEPQTDNTLLAVIVIAAAGGLTASLTALVIITHRNKLKKRRRQITVTGSRTI